MKWFLLLVFSLMSISPVLAQTQVFNNPRVNGYAVDRCLYFGSQCNQPAADEFCRRNGFQRARRFAWNFMAPTLVLGSRQICKVPGRGGCGGFTQITCTGGRTGATPPPPRGGKGPGDPCQTREECRSGICLLGVCS